MRGATDFGRVCVGITVGSRVGNSGLGVTREEQMSRAELGTFTHTRAAAQGAERGAAHPWHKSVSVPQLAATTAWSRGAQAPLRLMQNNSTLLGRWNGIEERDV